LNPLSPISRVWNRIESARALPSGLRLPFFRVPIERRAVRILGPRALSRVLPVQRSELVGYFDEVGPGSSVAEHIRLAEEEYYRLSPSLHPGTLTPAKGAALYAVMRALRAGSVVETGTASGVSSTYVLAALERNGGGRLVSIDLPFEDAGDGGMRPFVAGTAIDIYDSSPVPPGKEAGWIVPDGLRERWDLRLGDARDLLPRALTELGTIDVFFHDSLHSEEHMLFELNEAWPSVRPGGVVVADDIFQRSHDAVLQFARSVGRPWVAFAGLGFVVKPRS
jgi:predicted O-methyltransferase YrrM